ncbi:MAG TPA: hypothetical protein VF503_07230 [Sphingobium sp.]|uniref:hypothetical protein n=1 Tax=Sphingobium sp. TaxID=1912891 RepID=UPI002ECFEBF5
MLEEFSQAPRHIELDLTSYEGPWTHVAAFHGQSGWLMSASVTIQSEHDILAATLIAACDEYGTEIPAWRAAHLTECRWRDRGHCYDEPPLVLDDLLCEEEGAFYARWQREMNSELAGLYDRVQRNIEALEARFATSAREVERQIADLRRRRRMPDISIEARSTLGAIIADLEAENDQAMANMIGRRAELRRQADGAEEALWQRTDVLIEVEPKFVVEWRAIGALRRRNPLSETNGSGGVSLFRLHRDKLAELARRKAREEAEHARATEKARAAARKRDDETQTAMKLAESDGSASRPSNDLPKASPILHKLAVSAVEQAPAPQPHDPANPSSGKLRIERDMLAHMLAELEEKGRKFFSGSRKYLNNQEQKEELRDRIRTLDAKIARGGAPMTFREVPPQPGAVDARIQEIALARIAATAQQAKAVE